MYIASFTKKKIVYRVGSFTLFTLKKDQILNEELNRLLHEHDISVYKLAKRLGIRSQVLYRMKNYKANLGEELFVRILREGFGYCEKEVDTIFVQAVRKKYLHT